MRSVLNERRAADDAVHLVALLEQQLGQVGAVLAGDPGDERLLRHSGGTLPARSHTEATVPARKREFQTAV